MKHNPQTKAFLFLIVVTMISCGNEQQEEAKSPRPVTYQVVSYSGGGNVRTFSGTAQTDRIISLSFRSSGILTELGMKLGQKVKKGQLLAQLDNVQARLNYEKSVSSLNGAESQLNTTKLSLDRVRTLYEKGSASLSDYEAAKNSHRAASSNYESSKRSVAIQEEQIQHGYLYAPEDGVVAAVNAEIDENVSAGQNIGVLNAGATMEITLGIPESVINRIVQNEGVAIDFTSLQGRSFEGRVSEVSPSVDNNTSTYPVKVTVIDPTPDIKSGMAANVTFEFGDEAPSSKTIVVPAKAVGEDGNSNFVFVIEENNGIARVKKQPVLIGKLTSEGFEIKNGLSVGQYIAIAGLQTLLDRQEVKLH